MGSKTLKRLLTSVLSLSLLCTQFMILPTVIEADGASSTTEAEIILNTYDDQLSDEEKAVLGHAGIASNIVTYEAPTGPGNHVTLDNMELSVTDYTDSQGNVWVPVLVELVEGGTRTPLTLTNGKVTISPSSPSYSIEVKYDLYVNVPLETQTKLLNATYTLANGAKAIETLSVNAPAEMTGFDVAAQGKTMTQWLYSMVVDGITIQPEGFPNAMTVYISDAVTVAAIKDMHWQATRTGQYVNGNYDLNVLAKTFNSADKLGYILNSGVDVVAEAKETRDQVLSIHANRQMNSWYEFAGDGVEKDAIGIILNTALDNAKVLMSVVGRSDADAEAGNYTEYASVVNWVDVVLNSGLIANGADTAGLSALVDAAVAAGQVTDRTYTATNESLFVDTATVVLSLNNNDVTVKVEADVYNGSEKNTISSGDVILRLPTGSSLTTVESEIKSQVEDAFIAQYDALYQLTGGKYDRVPDYSVGDTLTEDSYYNIKYTPTNISVTTSIPGIEASYPYGYGLTLPSGYEQNLAYTYTLVTASGTEVKNEGAVYRIVEPVTITRTEDKASKSYRILALLADDPYYSFTDAEKAILKNLAVNSDVVSYKIPESEDADDLIELKASDGTLVAYPYDSGYNGLQWKPVGYYLNGTGSRIDFDGTANNIPDDTKSVVVDYELTVVAMENTSYISPLLTVASGLIESSTAQINALNSLVVELSKLETEGIDGATIFTALGALEQYIYSTYPLGDDTPWDDLDDEDQDVFTTIDNIKSGALEFESGTRKLVVQRYAANYEQNGLAMYYQKDKSGKTGYDYFNEQLELLSVGLPAVLASQKVSEFLQQDQYKSYAEKLDKVSTSLGAVKAALTPPSTDVNMESEALSSLFALLSQGGETSVQTAKGLTSRVNLLAADEGVETAKVTVTVNVMDLDGNTVKETATETKKYVVGGKFTAQEVAEINGLQAVAEASLNSNLDYYKATITGKFPTENDDVAEIDIVVTYTPLIVSVEINGEHVKVITGNDLNVPLPNHPNAGWKYVYSINGNELVVQDEVYTLNLESFRTYAQSGLLSISRTEVNVGESNLKEMFETLNDGLGNGDTKYILVSNEGASTYGLRANSPYAVVLRIDANELSTLMNHLESFVMAMATKVDYTYQAFGDNVYWNSPTISVQAIIDTLLESDLSMKKLDGIIADNGSIIDDVANELTSYSKIIVGTSDDMKNLGASLIETTLNVGVQGPEISMPFYLSIEDFGTPASSLVNAKKAITKVEPYLDVYAGNNTLNTVVTAPDRIYQIMLAGLLVTGYVDLDDISKVELEAVMTYLREQLNEAVLDDSVSSKTYKNTLKKLNTSVDITEHEDTIDSILNLIRKIRTQVTIVSESYNGNVYSAEFEMNIKNLMNSMGYGDYTTFIAEDKIVVPTSLTIDNLGTAYEAAIFDNAEAGLDKVYFTKDFATVAPTLSNNAVVILLNNVAGDVVLNNAIILDLNGKTMPSLKGNNGTTKIFNSAFEADGGVTGSVTGDFTIAGGKYTADVSSMVVDGYTQTAGVVESDLYRAYMNGTKLVVELEADFIDPAKETNLKYLAVDLALQLGLEFYTASKLTVDGSEIYAIETEDLIKDFFGDTNILNKVLHFANYPGLTSFTNKLIDDLTNWGALAAAVEAGEPLVSYNATTTPWGVNLTHIAAEDYLSIAVKGDAAVSKDYTLEIRVRGNASDSDNKTLAKLLRELENVLKVDADVALNDLSYSNENGLTGSYSGNGDVTIDFTQAPNGEHYTTLMGLILAYSNPSIKPAVQNYIDNGDVDGLIAAVDGLSVANVISAIKGIRGVSFAKLSNGYAASDVAYLESIYHVFLQGISGVMNKLDVTGRDTKIGGLTTTKGVYVIDKAWKNISGTVTLKLFAEKAPELEPYAYVNSNILGWEIDYANKEIRLDFAVTDTTNGLSLSKFGEDFYVGFDVNGGVVQSTTFDQKTIEAGLIRNGSVVVVKYAKTATSTPIEETWTIKVVGDVNGNGLIESNDAALIAKTFVDPNFTLNAIQEWAADVNGNGNFESNDALLNAYKWTLQTNKYTSKLRNVEEGK